MMKSKSRAKKLPPKNRSRTLRRPRFIRIKEITQEEKFRLDEAALSPTMDHSMIRAIKQARLNAERLKAKAFRSFHRHFIIR